MLVLTRKPGESIRISDNIKITIVDIDGSNIKIGIEAPRSVAVYREEVYEKIRLENQAAAERGNSDIASLQKMFKR